MIRQTTGWQTRKGIIPSKKRKSVAYEKSRFLDGYPRLSPSFTSSVTRNRKIKLNIIQINRFLHDRVRKDDFFLLNKWNKKKVVKRKFRLFTCCSGLNLRYGHALIFYRYDFPPKVYHNRGKRVVILSQ
jgi:hypothetical protein